MSRARPILVVTLALTLLTAPAAGVAQQAAKAWRIGILTVESTEITRDLVEAFKQGMRDNGYVEGKHVVFEHRVGGDRREQLAEAAAALVRSRPDVIVTSTDTAIAAVKQQTRTIPVVMANSTDPVTTGFVASLGRPGGNITGNSAMSPELSGKRLQLLREILPNLSRVAFLWNPDLRGAVLDFKETQDAARLLQIQVQSIELTRGDDLKRALAEATAGRAEALVVPMPNPLVYGRRVEVARYAQQHRLPSMFGTRDFVASGGLMAFGASAASMWRHAATYVDKVLKGTKPADIPVEQPTKFDLVINLKTARALGLTLPPSLLQRADQVIQ